VHNLVTLAADVLTMVDLLLFLVLALLVRKWWRKVLSLVAAFAFFKGITYVYNNYDNLWAFELSLGVFVAIVLVGVATSD